VAILNNEGRFFLPKVNGLVEEQKIYLEVIYLENLKIKIINLKFSYH
jgi:hypothetical protein